MNIATTVTDDDHLLVERGMEPCQNVRFQARETISIYAEEESKWDLGYTLARSGDFTGWLQIDEELRKSGYSRARQLLDDERTRERLNQMCAEARKDL